MAKNGQKMAKNDIFLLIMAKKLKKKPKIAKIEMPIFFQNYLILLLNSVKNFA